MHTLLGLVVVEVLDIIVVLHAVVHISSRHRTRRRRLSSRVGMPRAGGWVEAPLGTLLTVVGRLLVGLGVVRVWRISWQWKIRWRGIRVQWRLRLVIGRILISMEVVSFVVEVFVVILVVAIGCVILTTGVVVVAWPLFTIITREVVLLAAAHHRPRPLIAIDRTALLVPILPYWLLCLGLGGWRQYQILLLPHIMHAHHSRRE